MVGWCIVGNCWRRIVYFDENDENRTCAAGGYGNYFVDVRTSPGTNLEQTKVVMDEIDRRIKDIPQVRIFSKVTGNGMISGQGASNGMFIIRLKPWDERTGDEDEINAVINEIYKRTDDISSAQIMAFAQPMIPGYGVSSGFEIYVQDQKGGTIEDLLKYTRQMIDALNARPEIARARLRSILSSLNIWSR